MTSLKKLLDSKQENLYRTITLFSGKELEVKPWTVRDEKKFLMVVDDSNEDENVTIIETIKLINSCFRENYDILSFTESEFIDTVIRLREISKGSDIDYNYKCPSCGMKLPDSIRLENDVTVYRKKFDPTPIKIDNMIFTMEELSMDEKIALKKNYQNTIDYNFNYVIESVKEIEVDGVVYDEFSKKEVTEFIDLLNSDQFETLFLNLVKNISSIMIKKELRCGACTKEVKVLFDDNILKFLVF